MKEINIGLVEGRHPLPVDDFIFAEGDIVFPIDPIQLRKQVARKLDSLGVKPGEAALNVYVTGLTPATTAVIKVCMSNAHLLTLKHFDRDSQSWIDDPILTAGMVNHDTDWPSWFAC